MIDGTTGALALREGLDFEAPASADGDNVYEVVVAASDGLLEGTKALAITILDAQEAQTGVARADTLSGGSGADRFYFINRDGNAMSSSLASIDTVSDFNGTEGDRIDLTSSTSVNHFNGNVWPFNFSGSSYSAGPLVLRGAVNTPGFSLSAGATLGGSDLGTGFTQMLVVPHRFNHLSDRRSQRQSPARRQRHGHRLHRRHRPHQLHHSRLHGRDVRCCCRHAGR